MKNKLTKYISLVTFLLISNLCYALSVKVDCKPEGIPENFYDVKYEVMVIPEDDEMYSISIKLYQIYSKVNWSVCSGRCKGELHIKDKELLATVIPESFKDEKEKNISFRFSLSKRVTEKSNFTFFADDRPDLQIGGGTLYSFDLIEFINPGRRYNSNIFDYVRSEANKECKKVFGKEPFKDGGGATFKNGKCYYSAKAGEHYVDIICSKKGVESVTVESSRKRELREIIGLLKEDTERMKKEVKKDSDPEVIKWWQESIDKKNIKLKKFQEEYNTIN